MVSLCLPLEFALWGISWRFRNARVVLSKQDFENHKNVCTKFNTDANRCHSSTEGSRAASLIFTQSFGNFFFCRSRVLFQEYDKTWGLKVCLVIAGLCYGYCRILWMHCSLISWNYHVLNKVQLGKLQLLCQGLLVLTEPHSEITWRILVYDVTQRRSCALLSPVMRM